MSVSETSHDLSGASHVPSATSVALHINERHVFNEKPKKEVSKAKSCWRYFSVDGPFNYAFIYGSWEVVRARKVGTTRTVVDYVMYRLFYVIILVGLALFEMVKETKLGVFFCSMEIWILICQITYAFIFLQNVVSYNIHREDVKHRQKIPERLIVIDEVEKGGHKFYVYKRLSILPTDSLYNSEKIIYILFIIVSTTSVTTLACIIAGILKLHLLQTTITTMFALADLFCTPIPMKLGHVIFPLAFIFIYAGFIYTATLNTQTKLSFLDIDGDLWGSTMILLRLMGYTCIVHIILFGVVSFRDFIISLIDDSKTKKQQQSLRSQKRLARRRLMNFVEDETGKIVGISLEKHLMKDVFQHEQYIEAIKDQNKQSSKEESESSSSDDEAKQNEGPKSTLPPDLMEIKPPPAPRYPDELVTGDVFSSSSSDNNVQQKQDDDLKGLDEIKFPSPPKSKVDASTETDKKDPDKKKRKASRIPLPFHKLGSHLKPRDSKEDIQEKLEAGVLKRQDEGDESPPTPPFISLVQTMMKLRQQKLKKEATIEFKGAETLANEFPQEYQKLIQSTEQKRENEKLLNQKKADYLAKAKSQYKPRLSKTLIPDVDKITKSDKISDRGASGDKIVGSKVIFLSRPPPAPPSLPPEKKTDKKKEEEARYKNFHDQLTKKLLKENQRRKALRDKLSKSSLPKPEKKRRLVADLMAHPKSILAKQSEAGDLESRSQKRLAKVIQRRRERSCTQSNT